MPTIIQKLLKKNREKSKKTEELNVTIVQKELHKGYGHNFCDDKLFATHCALENIEHSRHEHADTTGISESFRAASLE